MNLPPGRRRWRPGLIAFLTLCGIALAGLGVWMWDYFGFSQQSTFAETTAVFGETDLRLPADIAGPTGRIRVVHFWDPSCSVCNRETGAHLSYLISMYRRVQIDFYSVRKPGTTGELPEYLSRRMQPLERIEGMEMLPASPAVGIWDRDGKLTYIGPYSFGMVCTSANSFVEPILDALVDGRPAPPRQGMLAVGCYCPWRQAVVPGG